MLTKTVALMQAHRIQSLTLEIAEKEQVRVTISTKMGSSCQLSQSAAQAFTAALQEIVSRLDAQLKANDIEREELLSMQGNQKELIAAIEELSAG